MGAFFTNVLLHTSSLGRNAMDAVAIAVDRALGGDGWKRASGAGGRSRRVFLVPADGWIAVYDEGTAVQEAELGRVASALSGILGCTAVSTRVHDSDALVMRVFDAGTAIGFVERGVEGARLNEGGFDPWRRLFPDLEGPLAAGALERKHTFVEDNLHEVATAIGLPVDAISTGFDYILEEAASRPGSHMLTYTPAALDEPTEPDVALVHAEDFAAHQGEAGEWSATFRNHGSAFRGLSVTVHQPEGLVLFDRIRVTVGGPLSPGEPIVAEAAFVDPRSLSEPVALDFDTITLPAGAPLAHLGRLKLLGFEEWARVAMPTLITVDLRLVPAASGAGRLILAAAPLRREASAQHDIACVVA